MSITKKTVNTLVASAFVATMASAVMTTPAHAAKEKCYGVVKAGQNGCADSKGVHSCQAHATVDGAGSEWISLPSGVCDKIVGGSTEPFEKAEAEIAPAVKEEMTK